MEKQKKKNLLLRIVLITEIIVVLGLADYIGYLVKEQIDTAKANAMVAELKSQYEQNIEVTEEPVEDTTKDMISQVDNVIGNAVVSLTEWKPLYTKSDFDESSIATETSIPGDTVRDDELNIVVFGDSIWDFNRGDNSVAELLQADLQEKYMDFPVNVYNLAVGGTCAAVIDGKLDLEQWDSKCLTAILYSMEGMIDPEEQFEGENMLEVLPEIDFDKVDYFIISYGLNDYFFANKVTGDDYFDLYSYAGSLRHAVFALRQKYPNARFLIMSPTFCQFYYYDEVIDTCLTRTYTKDGEEGPTLDKYVGGAALVSNELHTLYLDAFNDFDLGADSQPECSKDGVHFNEKGRTIYAEQVAECLSADFDAFK